MSIDRRKFIKLSSITLAGIPLSSLSAKTSWYDGSSTSVAGDDDLYNLFKNPTGVAKPFVRWWWNGNRVVKEEIIRELDMLQAAGIGGVEINSVKFPETADPLNYKELQWLGPDWCDMLKVAVDAAKERGLICDIIVGSGWPFGAEYLSKDEQTQMMALGTKNLKGPMLYEVSRAQLESEVDPPIASKNPEKYKELSFIRLVPAQLQSFDPGIDFNAKVKDENIQITVPEGDYVLYYLVKLTGFEKVINGAPGASGPVLNHYNQAAVEKFLNRMSDSITARLGNMGAHFRSLFADSLELEGANWCDDMAEQFKQRRGYALEPYLPFILFKIIGHAFLADEVYGTKLSPQAQEIINNVRYDFETTRLELFDERFYNTYLNWCKKNGVKSRVQAYGMEFHPIEAAMKMDLPEGESWIKPDVGEVFPDNAMLEGRAYRAVNKLVTSGARLAGKRLIGCEEGTNTQMVFNATLERLKITGDQSNLSGTTHSIFHGFNYSPKDALFPGWVRYGTFINERNPIWPYFNLWFKYKARLSALFQNSELFSDIAVMLPLADIWKGYGTDWYPRPQKARPVYAHNVWEAIHQNGSSCDYISENILKNAKFNDGTIQYGNRTYKTLLLVEVESIHPDTAMAISNFAKAGGRIIFIEKWPVKSAGLKNYAENSKKVKDIIEKARQKYSGKVVVYPAPKPDERIIDWYKGLQTKHNIKPYIKIDKTDPFVSQVYYKAPGLDIFFIVNYGISESHEFNAAFNTSNKTAWIWNAETGERYIYPANGANNNLHISLGPASSKLIVFEEKTKGEKFIPAKLDERQMLTFSEPWKLTLNHIDGSTKNMVIERLIDFKEDQNLDSFAGTAMYENTIQINEPRKLKYLNLGKIYGVTEVIINGKSLGTQWYGNRIYAVSNALVAGKNTVTVKLTTTMGNYMKSLKDNKDSIKWVKKGPLYSQGMIGPVVFG